MPLKTKIVVVRRSKAERWSALQPVETLKMKIDPTMYMKTKWRMTKCLVKFAVFSKNSRQFDVKSGVS